MATTIKHSLADVIEIYTLAIAYLHNASFDVEAVGNTVYVREMVSNLFYIWQQQEYEAHRDAAFPLAKCMYNQRLRRWKVELLSGETLDLLDKGSIWERLSDEDMERIRNRKQRPPYKRRTVK
jgi:hypothetical protein